MEKLVAKLKLSPPFILGATYKDDFAYDDDCYSYLSQLSLFSTLKIIMYSCLRAKEPYSLGLETLTFKNLNP